MNRPTVMQDLHKFSDLVRQFRNAMLVTQDGDGHLRGRPMVIARAEEDGTLWFISDLHAETIDDVLSHTEAAAVMQQDNRHLSVSGSCRVRQDEEMMREICRSPTFEDARAYLHDSDRRVLVEFSSHVAEYWQQDAGLLRFALTAARSALRRSPLPRPGEAHSRIELD